MAALADDLPIAIAIAKKVRLVAPTPGKTRIGFELSNEKRLPVILRELVEDRRLQTLDVPLPVVLGRDIVGNPVYADLASMPRRLNRQSPEFPGFRRAGEGIRTLDVHLGKAAVVSMSSGHRPGDLWRVEL